jgi:hypothetical protein
MVPEKCKRDECDYPARASRSSQPNQYQRILKTTEKPNRIKLEPLVARAQWPQAVINQFTQKQATGDRLIQKHQDFYLPCAYRIQCVSIARKLDAKTQPYLPEKPCP